ncbi:MAG: nuclear transport factor 2 family protein [Rhodanobacteraceae bacterium]|nr:nuclear transport factor 2 family protein [Rhodanobacteraceae bacterium]
MRTLLRLLPIAVSLLLSACNRAPDEQRIREAVTAMEAAVEARNPRDFMVHVADDFVGRDSGFDRTSLHNLLRAQFLRNQAVGVVIGPIDVVLQPPRATARMSVTLSGSTGGLLPERGAIYSVETGWKLVDGQWRCLSASWEQR